MRLGVFGGSFDPIHYGHLLLAECCRDAHRLDRVLFMPTAIAPHKLDQPTPTGRQRAEMVRRAVADYPALEVSTLELDRGGVSYTVDTLEQLDEQHPQAELYLLLGADSLADLPTWRSPERICQFASLIAVRRAGFPEPDFAAIDDLVSPARLASFRALTVDMPPVGISSTDLRDRVAAGQTIRFRTPDAVIEFIHEQGLYRAS